LASVAFGVWVLSGGLLLSAVVDRITDPLLDANYFSSISIFYFAANAGATVAQQRHENKPALTLGYLYKRPTQGKFTRGNGKSDR